VLAYDTHADAAHALAHAAHARLGVPVAAVARLEDATRAAAIVVTCTPARQAFLAPDHVPPGAFVAAVGADNEAKSEITPALMAASAVVVDDLAQCRQIGDLHHALDAGAMREDDVRADLAAVVADPRRGRRGADEIVLFDSTGVAIEDVAAAAVVYERALGEGGGATIAFGA
jgi:ornithine cyclodeaminase/alanine dehydrogenase-like protein (mu-crystallin family)